MADEDPFKVPEGTSIRPRPGAGRRGLQEPTRLRAAPPHVETEAIPEPAR